ncbi:myosin-11-like isoform X2 [Salvia splendens]|uniref:myosin-11-like isoform X2 n=1 Tax=Salvia splendens TaxID=180675 RepID=UPI001C268422|nr:myosin-11-like isoform X2 [Salvia splendens]
MFKSARWRSDKNKVKVVFKLQFHAAKVSQIGGDALMVSVVPADIGKPTVKSDKVLIRDESCFWENPVYETVKFSREPKTGKIHERIYYFVVGTGSSKGGVLGEASIDFSNYVELNKLSIQRIQESIDEREIEETESVKLYKENSLKSQLNNGDEDGTIKSSSDDLPLNKTVTHIVKFNGNRRTSSGSDLTISSSDGSSGVEIPWQPQIKNGSAHQEPASVLPSLRPNSDTQPSVHEERQRSQSDWSGNSALEVSTDDSSGTPRDTLLRQNSDESSGIVIEKLKSENAALSRQAEISELELQTLRKQIVKESKRGQDLFRELACLKEERDALKGESDMLKASRIRIDGERSRTNSLDGGGESYAIVEELRQELKHAKELNANLKVQLQKTQESNSELLLAVKDLEEMLEQKDGDVLNLSSGSSTKEVEEKSYRACQKHRLHNDNDDEEQKALEELVKEHDDTKQAYVLEQQIMDMRSEIEIYKRDKDELEMQMEQLALDYEIMKQENHEMSYKLEQSELQEQLKMQYECSSSYATTNELESQIENLENELRRQSKESADAFVKISELETHVKSLEEDLENQLNGFEADLEALMSSKVEQEQRAIRAENILRKTRSQNASTAKRIQEEFRRLSVQMATTFVSNEKLAAKALAEGNELRLEKFHLEEAIKKTFEEHQSVKSSYEDSLCQLASQVKSMANQIEKMHSEIDDKTSQLEYQKKQTEESLRFLSDEVLKLKEEISSCGSVNKLFSEDLGCKELLLHELEQIRNSIKERDLLVLQRNEERIVLENRIASLKNEAEESQKELNKMRCLLEEKELIVGTLQSELESLHSQYDGVKHSLSQYELENVELRKKVSQLKDDLKKNEDALRSMEKMMQDVAKATSETLKPVICGSIEVADLKERIKLLEGQIKLKESTLEISNNSFLEKEKDLHHKIEELERRMEVLNQTTIQYENGLEKIATISDEQDPNVRSIEEATKSDEDSTNLNGHNDNPQDAQECSRHRNELTIEVELLKERNKLMEEELKEMQERYSETSLKFAEVEGERQQLVMKVRNLKNKKNHHSAA